MALDKATVVNIAKLARIKVPEADIEPLARELGGILGWVAQLSELDTADVPAMTSVVAVRLPRRSDKVSDGGCPDQILANAPRAEHGFFVVPKVVE